MTTKLYYPVVPADGREQGVRAPSPSVDRYAHGPFRILLRDELPVAAAFSLARYLNSVGSGRSMLVLSGKELAIELDRLEDADRLSTEFADLLSERNYGHDPRR